MKAIKRWSDLDEFAGQLVAFKLEVKKNHSSQNIPNYYRSDKKMFLGYVSLTPHVACVTNGSNKEKGYWLHGVFNANEKSELFDLTVTDEGIGKFEIVVRCIQQAELEELEQKINQGKVNLDGHDKAKALEIIAGHKNIYALESPRTFTPLLASAEPGDKEPKLTTENTQKSSPRLS